MRAHWDRIPTRRRDGRNACLHEGVSAQPEVGAKLPVLRLYESKEDYLVVVSLPGIPRENILLDVTEESLTVAGHRQLSEEVGEDRFRRQERWRGEWDRRIFFPTRVKPDEVHAEMENGLLSIRLPKQAASKPRRVDIQSPTSERKP
ncbi:MAG: Hsp20/alpha crystallin family protein [Planctomycetota bacterium]